MLVVCGSVSAWIEQNILKNADFVGRISLQMLLEELPLSSCARFWGRRKLVSPLEKLKILSVTGGVPKYLEEVIPSRSAEENILRLCFTAEGSLFNEFDKIFNEIFTKRNSMYNKIVRRLAQEKLSSSHLAFALGVPANGVFTEYLNNLEISGFIKRDYIYDLRGKELGASRYRLKDNYLRFYFKYIEPNRARVLNKSFGFESVYQFSNWQSVVGLQFENLILQNLFKLYDLLEIRMHLVKSACPYIQRKTARTKGACQIDILIVTEFKTIYLCELKVREKIDAACIKEVQRKIESLRIPRGYSLRPVLIYEGTVSEQDSYKLKAFFDYLISFEQFF